MSLSKATINDWELSLKHLNISVKCHCRIVKHFYVFCVAELSLSHLPVLMLVFYSKSVVTQVIITSVAIQTKRDSNSWWHTLLIIFKSHEILSPDFYVISGPTNHNKNYTFRYAQKTKKKTGANIF